MDYSICEKELIKKLKTGDSDSYTFLYNLYGDKILNLAYKMTGNYEDAADITQNTFLQAYSNIAGFNNESKIYTWLFVIAKNLCLRHLSNKKNSVVSLQQLIDTAQHPEAEEKYTHLEKQFYINQIKDGCLLGLLRCLSFYQRIAFILQVLLDIDVKDIAAIIDKSESATRTLVHRAKKNIKEFLCKNCSLYNESNTCHCENLIDFSLKQGWIPIASGNNFEEIKSITTMKVEKEINDLNKILLLYNSIKEPCSNKDLTEIIKKIIVEKNYIIFSEGKVK